MALMLSREYLLTFFREGISVRLHNILAPLLTRIVSSASGRAAERVGDRPDEGGDRR